jgi:hypothetical protein
MNTMLVPIGYKATFNLKNPMSQTGFLKSHDHMIYMMVFSGYLMSHINDLGHPYKEFVAMYGNDLTKIMNPVVNIKELREQVIFEVYESAAVKQGLFPDSEAVFIYHQLSCIVNHIEQLGHVKGLMCFFGERAMGVIAGCMNDGGVHYMKPMYYNYVDKENAIFNSDFSVNPDFMDNRGQYTDFATLEKGLYSFVLLCTESQYSFVLTRYFLYSWSTKVLLLFVRAGFFHYDPLQYWYKN